MGYSPWVRKELDTTEQLHFTSLHFKGRRNLTCLKNYQRASLGDGVEAVMGRVIEVVRGPLHPEKGSGLNSEITCMLSCFSRV